MERKPGYAAEADSTTPAPAAAAEKKSSPLRGPAYATTTERLMPAADDLGLGAGGMGAGGIKTAADALETSGAAPPASGWVKGGGLFLLAVLGIFLLNQGISLWEKHWILGFLSTAFLFLAALGLYKIWEEERKAKDRIEQLQGQQERVQQALEQNDLLALKRALEPWLERQSLTSAAEIERFREAASERKTAKDYWRLYETLVLKPLDTQANRIIHHYVITTSAAVMVIPHPALDALVLLWRSRALVSALARVYGVETTTLSSLRLFKQALVTVAIVSGIEALTQEQLLEEGSKEIQNRLLSIGSQAAITFWRTYKLGKLIQVACRPQPKA